MTDPVSDSIDSNTGLPAEPPGLLSGRISVDEIARRLDLGRLAIYAMLERGIIPAIRLGRRWIITRHAFEQWERTAGMTGLRARTEVTVLN